MKFWLVMALLVLAALIVAGWTWDEDVARGLISGGFKVLGPHEGGEV